MTFDWLYLERLSWTSRLEQPGISALGRLWFKHRSLLILRRTKCTNYCVRRRTTQPIPVRFSIHRKPTSFPGEKNREICIEDCNLVMHYFALAADTKHHGTIFVPIVHSVPRDFVFNFFKLRFRFSAPTKCWELNVNAWLFFVFTV